MSIKSIESEVKQVKPAAIFARVSTSGQSEASLPSQVGRCKGRLEQAGYAVTHTFAVDWCSLDLWACPEFQRLRSLISSGQIKALAVFDRDRLEAKGLQRLVFLSDLRDAGIELIICQGPQIVEGPEGQIVELALAIGKERQVLRARQGAKDGIRDRVVLRRKPVSYRAPYGYSWDDTRTRLLPNGDYENLKLVLNMAVEGKTYAVIIQELKRRAVASPAGFPEWRRGPLSRMVNNPVYAGRYAALKSEAVEPRRRRCNTYGKSSNKRLPPEQWQYLPDIEVVNPPLTWEQRAVLLGHLEQRQKLSRRNAKREYLLRGRVFCEIHRGVEGKPHAYVGHWDVRVNRWLYRCPIGGCDSAYIDGPELERYITYLLWRDIFALGHGDALIEGSPDQTAVRTSLESEIARLQREDNAIINKQVTLEDDRLEGRFGDLAVYERLRNQYQARRAFIKVRLDEILEQLGQVAQQDEAEKSLSKIRGKFASAILKAREVFNGGGVSRPPEIMAIWRQILEIFNLRINVYSPDAQGEHIHKVRIRNRLINVSIAATIPIETESEPQETIAFSSPRSG